MKNFNLLFSATVMPPILSWLFFLIADKPFNINLFLTGWAGTWTIVVLFIATRKKRDK